MAALADMWPMITPFHLRAGLNFVAVRYNPSTSVAFGTRIFMKLPGAMVVRARHEISQTTQDLRKMKCYLGKRLKTGSEDTGVNHNGLAFEEQLQPDYRCQRR